ncbi:MAG: NifB/NifX family molybdenum-iron cluster-binding protein [Desulfococcaceae bacterium]
MKVVFPAVAETGMESPVHDHFGTASFFMFVDSENGESKVTENMNMHHKQHCC